MLGIEHLISSQKSEATLRSMAAQESGRAYQNAVGSGLTSTSPEPGGLVKDGVWTGFFRAGDKIGDRPLG